MRVKAFHCYPKNAIKCPEASVDNVHYGYYHDYLTVLKNATTLTHITFTKWSGFVFKEALSRIH